MAISIGLCGKYFDLYTEGKADITKARLQNELQEKGAIFNDKVYTYAELVNEYALNGVEKEVRRYSNKKVNLEYKELKNPVTSYFVLGHENMGFDCKITKSVYDFILYIIDCEKRRLLNKTKPLDILGIDAEEITKIEGEVLYYSDNYGNSYHGGRIQVSTARGVAFVSIPMRYGYGEAHSEIKMFLEIDWKYFKRLRDSRLIDVESHYTTRDNVERCINQGLERGYKRLIDFIELKDIPTLKKKLCYSLIMEFIEAEAQKSGLYGRLFGRLDDDSLTTRAQWLEYMRFLNSNAYTLEELAAVIEKSKLYNCSSDWNIKDNITGFIDAEV